MPESPAIAARYPKPTAKSNLKGPAAVPSGRLFNAEEHHPKTVRALAGHEGQTSAAIETVSTELIRRQEEVSKNFSAADSGAARPT